MGKGGFWPGVVGDGFLVTGVIGTTWAGGGVAEVLEMVVMVSMTVPLMRMEEG